MNTSTKDQLEFLKSLISIIWIGILTIGGIIVACYCLSEGFFPDGISFGDAFILGYTSFSFVVFLVIGTVFGGICAFWFVALLIFTGNWYFKKRKLPEIEFIDKLNNNLIVKLCASIITKVLLSVILVSSHDPVDMRLYKTVAFFFLAGFFVLCLFSAKKPKNKIMRSKFENFIILLLLVIAEMTTVHPALLNISMGLAGIRFFPVNLVIFSDTAYQYISQIAKINNLNVKLCKIANTDKWGTFDARIVWNGIGSTSYVRIMDKNSGGNRTILTPVKKDDVEMLRGDNIHLNCQ